MIMSNDIGGVDSQNDVDIVDVVKWKVMILMSDDAGDDDWKWCWCQIKMMLVVNQSTTKLKWNAIQIDVGVGGGRDEMKWK